MTASLRKDGVELAGTDEPLADWERELLENEARVDAAAARYGSEARPVRREGRTVEPAAGYAAMELDNNLNELVELLDALRVAHGPTITATLDDLARKFHRTRDDIGRAIYDYDTNLAASRAASAKRTTELERERDENRRLNVLVDELLRRPTRAFEAELIGRIHSLEETIRRNLSSSTASRALRRAGEAGNARRASFEARERAAEASA